MVGQGQPARCDANRTDSTQPQQAVLLSTATGTSPRPPTSTGPNTQMGAGAPRIGCERVVGLGLGEPFGLVDAPEHAKPLGAYDPDALAAGEPLAPADEDSDGAVLGLGLAVSPGASVGCPKAFNPRARLTVATSVAIV